MGNLNCHKNIKEKEYLYKTENDNILYYCDTIIKYSIIKNVETNEKYVLYLGENDIILKNEDKEHRFIYHKVRHWIYSQISFGFLYQTYNNVNNIKYNIILEVENGYEIANNIKKLIYNLKEYYETI